MTIMTEAVQGVIEYDRFSRWSILLQKHHLVIKIFLLANIHARLFCCFASLFGIFIAVRIVTRIRALVRVEHRPI